MPRGRILLRRRCCCAHTVVVLRPANIRRRQAIRHIHASCLYNIVDCAQTACWKVAELNIYFFNRQLANVFSLLAEQKSTLLFWTLTFSYINKYKYVGIICAMNSTRCIYKSKIGDDGFSSSFSKTIA